MNHHIIFDELCKATSAKALKEMPNESGRYLLFKGLRVYGNEETQEYSLFYLFNAIDVNAGLKEVDEIKTSFLLPYLDDEIKTQADLCGYEVALQC